MERWPVASSGQLLDSLLDATIVEELDEDGLRQAIVAFWDEANALACVERCVRAGAHRSWPAKDVAALCFSCGDFAEGRVPWVFWVGWALHAGQAPARRLAAATAS